MRQYPGEEGVSEMVGVMLLLGLTVIGVAFVGIVFLSDSWPDAIPRAAIAAGNESGSLVLVHEGGDPLRAGEYRIYVDTGSGLTIGTDSFTEPEDGAWSVGKSLVYNGTGMPERVIVTAVSGGSETVLAEPEFRGGTGRFSPDPVGPGKTPVAPGTPESGGGGNSSPIQIVFPEDNSNLTFVGGVAAMKANVTLQDADRVDFILYPLDQSRQNHKETLMRSVTKGPDGNYIWSNIPGVGDSGLANVVNEDKVVMIAVAYKGEEVIGAVAHIATVTRLT